MSTSWEKPRPSFADHTEIPLLTSTPTPGAEASDSQPPDEVFQQFFKRHYGKLERMFMSQFSVRKSKHASTSKGKARRVLELSDDSSPDDTYYRDKTPDAQHTRRHRSRTPQYQETSPYIHHYRGSLPRSTPFSRHIVNYPAPPEFKIPSNLKLYDDTTDPDDNLSTYNNIMNIYSLPMPVCYKVFSATLIDKACLWFQRLPPGSITSYEQLEAQFKTHFFQLRRFQKTKAEFMAIR